VDPAFSGRADAEPSHDPHIVGAMGRSAAERREELVTVLKEARGCTRCTLAAGRTQVVFGAGNADAELMFVGEAPGFHEDRQGIPFVGRAGQLLEGLLAENGMARDEVFIANVLMCRPPGNRDPEAGEIATCQPYLMAKIELIEPSVICTLGNFATKLLSGSSAGITRVHGQPQLRELGGRIVRLYPLFHPAAALRTPRVKEQLGEDFSRLPALLAEGPPAQPGQEPAPAAPVVAAADREPELDQLGLFG
jgi:DNA polymerase